MKNLNRLFGLVLASLLLLTGCDGDSSINLISREDGSGTRGAFVEIIGLLEKNGEDELDLTYEEAIIQNTTDGVLNTVEGDPNSIGYVSTGSLKDSVKTLAVDGTRPSPDQIKSGGYKISRPFILAYKKDLDPLEEDFLNFILSKEAQSLVDKSGYIPLSSDYNYQAGNLEGRLVVAGSTSVTPLMEKLKEAYEALNKNSTIEIQSNGSSTGIKATIEDQSNLAMSSRHLKEDEKAVLKYSTLAMDGIALIVNKDNPVNNIKLEDLRKVYKGEILDWEEIDK